MKIKTTFNIAQVVYLDLTIDQFIKQHEQKYASLSKPDKSILSILQDVSDRISTRARSIKPRTPKDKKFIINWKFHEAFAICTLAFKVKDHETDAFCKMVANKIYTDLDQKLA